MRILGLNAYAHDAGIALLRDGEIEVVVEEERFDRVRKSQNFPAQSIQECLLARHIDLDDIDHVVFPWRTFPFVVNWAGLVLKTFPVGLNLLRRGASPNMNAGTAIRFILLTQDIRRILRRRPTRKVLQVSHHICHAAGAFFTSPFEEAAVLVMDGYGENVSTSFYEARGTKVTPLYRNRFLNSMGILYSLVTLHLGYQTVMDEGKVMSLASYGTDALVDEFHKIVRLLPDGRYEFDYSYLDYHRWGELRPFTKKFERIFGPRRRPDEPIEQRHRDLAHALQAVLEETVLHTVRGLAARVKTRNLCFTGGTALNCIANGRILKEGPFERVFIPSNPNDAGVALGATLHLYHTLLDKPREKLTLSPFQGPRSSTAEVQRALKEEGCKYRECEDACQEAAALLAEGKVIGWFYGKMEMGPRALGNRSILADARRPEMRDYLNQQVKHREAYRPYAPAVLEERVNEFFDFQGVSPYMSFAAKVKPQVRAMIPSVVHVDGTSRIQTVRANSNPRFWRLIKEFEQLTGIPMVLNTSFNVQEPIVCRPQDAVATFRRAHLDALFIEDFRVDKE